MATLERLQDQTDFLQLLYSEDPELGDWARARFTAGASVRQVRDDLRRLAEITQGWCIGRFGS